MKRVALATSAEYPDLAPDDQLMLGPLRDAGIAGMPATWTDERVDWASFDAVVIRSTWDYFEKQAEYRTWLTGLAARGIAVHNPVDVVLGNFDKRYLRDLERDGVPVVPTVWVETASDLASRLAALPWERVVVKPTVSAGAFRTHLTTKTAMLAVPSPVHEILGGSAVMIQPFLEQIVRDGEWSFLYFGGSFSHAVRKRPKGGDFRVQWRHGGSHVGERPPPHLIAQADAVQARLRQDLLFARVDGVDVDGRLAVIEIEMIEPYLFLGESAGSARRFAEALGALVSGA